MDNLKKNLHFVVFGAGVLLGVVFLLVGIMVRGGKEQGLADAQAKLPAPNKVETKGTLDDRARRFERFGESLKEAEAKLTAGPGAAFNTQFETYGSGSEFYTSEGRPALQKLKARFAALEKPTPMPALLEGWEIKPSSPGADDDKVWEQIEREMPTIAADRIVEKQMQLRILQELAAACEQLVAAGIDEPFGVKLLEIKFEPFGGGEMDSPWMSMPFRVNLQCSPAFAAALTDELVNPTSLTMGGQGENARRGFPILLDVMQTEMMERPAVVRYHIANEDKAGIAHKLNEMGKGIELPPDPTQLDPETGEGKKLFEAAKAVLNDEDRVALPIRLGLKLRAAAINKEWRAIKAEEQNP